MNAGHWASLAERGSALGLRLTETCYRLLGERVTRILLVPIAAYFLLAAGEARRASFDYFGRLQRFGSDAQLPRPGWRTSFLHMLAFAESALHKLGAWMQRVDPQAIDFPQRSTLDALVRSGRGALLVSAHIGNIEMLRALAVTHGLTAVNAVVYTRHAARFKRILERANASFGVNLLEVSELGPDTGMMLSEKIDRGEILVIVGDRIPAAERGRTCRADFLGVPARFPQGPYILAASLQCPVYTFFCVKAGSRYRVHFDLLADRIVLPRTDRRAALEEYAREYARRMEAMCIGYPYQWFNFYDFWQAEERAPESRKNPLTH